MAEVDASMMHVYGISRDDVGYMLDTFPILKRREIADHGSFRTKGLILDLYDRMAAATESSVPYQTVLDPPPADPSLRVDLEVPRE